MRKLKEVLKYMPVGGLLFWGTSAVLNVEYVTSELSPPDWIWLKIIVLPIVTVGGFIAIQKSSKQPIKPLHVIGCFLGVWVFATFYAVVVDMPGDFGSIPITKVPYSLCLFPVTTLIYAAFDGSLHGLIATSAVLLIVFIISIGLKTPEIRKGE
jgi:hypothetical protein